MKTLGHLVQTVLTLQATVLITKCLTKTVNPMEQQLTLNQK